VAGPNERTGPNGSGKTTTLRMIVNIFYPDGGEIRVFVRAWLDRFDLAGWASYKVEALIKGMSQKVQFIAAVIPEPRLVRRARLVKAGVDAARFGYAA